MSNDNGIVDEYEKIENLKKEIEAKEEAIKNKIIELAKQKNTEVLFGAYKKCSIKEYEKIIYPEDKSLLIDKIKSKGIYNQYSTISHPKLSSAIVKGSIDLEITNLVKKEKA
ncbi:MAG: hypothetical protein AABX85_00695 [Nanoarchaeota archaeon]